MRISDWSSDVCSSDLLAAIAVERGEIANRHVDGAADADDRHAGVAARGNGRLVDRAGDAADPELLPGEDARRHRQVAADGLRHDLIPRPDRELDAAEPECRHLVGELGQRSEEHTSELQSLIRISYAVFCLNKKIKTTTLPTLQLFTPFMQ